MMPRQPGPTDPSYTYAQDPLVVTARAPLRPLGVVLRQLPAQYRHILRRPSVAAFVEELPQAEWRSVWMQLLGWGLVAAVVGFVAWLVHPIPNVVMVGPPSTATLVVVPSSPYGGQLLSIPLGFFIGMGLLYLTARLLGGQGTFLAQSYASVLVHAPLGVLVSILGAIPYISILTVIVAIYVLVLQVYAVSAAHRVGLGRGVVIVILPTVAVIVVVALLGIVFSVGLVGGILS